MEHGGTKPDERGCAKNGREARTKSEQHHPDERKCHSDGQRLRLWTLVCIDADHRLKQRRGDLTDERDEADLPEAEAERLLQHRIDRWQKRLHQVVEQVAETETREDARRKLHASILVVVKADEKHVKNHGTRVAMSMGNFARPHLTEDGNTQPKRREAFFASPLAMY